MATQKRYTTKSEIRFKVEWYSLFNGDKRLLSTRGKIKSERKDIDRIASLLNTADRAIKKLQEENAQLKEAAEYVLTATPYPSVDDLQVYVVGAPAIEELRRAMGRKSDAPSNGAEVEQ